jgi:hypothetical protein
MSDSDVAAQQAARVAAKLKANLPGIVEKHVSRYVLEYLSRLLGVETAGDIAKKVSQIATANVLQVLKGSDLPSQDEVDNAVWQAISKGGAEKMLLMDGGVDTDIGIVILRDLSRIKTAEV